MQHFCIANKMPFLQRFATFILHSSQLIDLGLAMLSVLFATDGKISTLQFSRSLSSGPIVIESIKHELLFDVGAALQLVKGGSANSAHELAEHSGYLRCFRLICNCRVQIMYLSPGSQRN